MFLFQNERDIFGRRGEVTMIQPIGGTRWEREIRHPSPSHL